MHKLIKVGFIQNPGPQNLYQNRDCTLFDVGLQPVIGRHGGWVGDRATDRAVTARHCGDLLLSLAASPPKNPVPTGLVFCL